MGKVQGIRKNKGDKKIVTNNPLHLVLLYLLLYIWQRLWMTEKIEDRMTNDDHTYAYLIFTPKIC